MRSVIFTFFLFLVYFKSFSQSILVGKIGSNAVTFVLYGGNDEENGSYFYDKHLLSIPLHYTNKGNSYTLKSIPKNEDELIETITLLKKGTNFSGTWNKQGKKLKVSLVEKPLSDFSNHRFQSNPFYQAQNHTTEEQIKLNHFKLISLDSVLQIGPASIRYFRETHTKMDHFRIDSGLSAVQLNNANQFLEWQQAQEFLNYFSCYSDNTFGNGFDYEVHYSDIFINQHLLSFVHNNYNYCGGAHPNYYMTSSNFDLQNGKILDNENMVSEFGQTAVSNGEVDEYDNPITNFQSTVFNYLKQTYPEQMTNLEEADWTEGNQDYCQFGRIGIWDAGNALSVTPEGLYVIVNFEHFRNDCTGSGWTIVPFEQLTQVLNPDFLKKLK